jgi:Aldehyde dehydrogenase family
MTFRTPDEAVLKANNSPYGLSAGVWTEKGSRAMGMAAALRAGVIWDNTFNRFDPAASFGGYKESGFGREGGPSGLAAYLDTDDEGQASVRSERPARAAGASGEGAVRNGQAGTDGTRRRNGNGRTASSARTTSKAAKR